ncbi:tripartite tricarboxylate transporter permease [Pararhodobacter sp. SW119]|uniref:tripartite tricarboxylate transporter permease n=1 Tax=Pararhodobacter sp. SW119 TaxID=2780075 RepID=UPI001ADF1C72|nr:tripartite tricarboxylate transporter permease [Pararhodobacter sp. SW119]
MDLFANLALGFHTAVSPAALFFCFLGVTLGTLIGVLPGIGAMAAIAMLLPVTYHIPPTEALIMLAGIYYGAQYGGSTASILLRLPGTPQAAVVTLDGYPMAQQGRAGVALFITTIASFAGSVLGVLLLAGFAPLLARAAMSFQAAEYFALMVLGLMAAALLTQGSPVRGLIMVAAGLILGTVGTDLQTGTFRFVYGIPELADGIGLVAMAMGLFGVSEVIANAARGGAPAARRPRWREMIPTRADWRAAIPAMTRGAGIGAGFGTLPGTGSSIASFVSYAVEKRIARDPSRFGKGAIEGISAPEAANNAAAQTAFIPTLTLGVPGDAVLALMLGALIIHGIIPGPGLIAQQPALFWGLVASFVLGNLMLLVLNLPLIGLWISILRIPYRLLYPAILVFICIGVFSIRNSAFDIWLVLIFGAIGYGMRLLRFEPAPLLLGFILGPLLEQYLRRAMTVSRGDPMIFLERPISAAFLGLAALLLLHSLYTALRRRG